MKKNQLTTKLFCLSCESQPGVLSRIIMAFARPCYHIATLSQSATDVSGIVLVTAEVAIPSIQTDNMLRRLQKIVGVLEVTISFGAVPQAAVYRLWAAQCDDTVWQYLRQYGVQMITQQDGHLLVQQIAGSAEIRRLFNALDGPALVGFSQLPVPVSQPLSWDQAGASLSGMTCQFRAVPV